MAALRSERLAESLAQSVRRDRAERGGEPMPPHPPPPLLPPLFTATARPPPAPGAESLPLAFSHDSHLASASPGDESLAQSRASLTGAIHPSASSAALEAIARGELADQAADRAPSSSSSSSSLPSSTSTSLALSGGEAGGSHSGSDDSESGNNSHDDDDGDGGEEEVVALTRALEARAAAMDIAMGLPSSPTLLWIPPPGMASAASAAGAGGAGDDAAAAAGPPQQQPSGPRPSQVTTMQGNPPGPQAGLAVALGVPLLGDSEPQDPVLQSPAPSGWLARPPAAEAAGVRGGPSAAAFIALGRPEPRLGEASESQGSTGAGSLRSRASASVTAVAAGPPFAAALVAAPSSSLRN